MVVRVTQIWIQKIFRNKFVVVLQIACLNLFCCIFLYEKYSTLFQIFVPRDPIDNKTALVKIMDWYWTCNKQLARSNDGLIHWHTHTDTHTHAVFVCSMPVYHIKGYCKKRVWWSLNKMVCKAGERSLTELMLNLSIEVYLHHKAPCE